MTETRQTGCPAHGIASAAANRLRAFVGAAPEFGMFMHLDGVLATWKWETQIRAQNELTTVRYANDYDAIVTVRIGHNDAEFALEYERMAKTHARYEGIRQAIESEPYVQRFVYAAANYDLLNYFGQHFARMRQRVHLCLFDDLSRNGLHAEAVTPGAASAGTLGDVLCLAVY